MIEILMLLLISKNLDTGNFKRLGSPLVSRKASLEPHD